MQIGHVTAKNVTRGGAQHQDQHGKTMRVEPLRSSTEGVANIEKDGNEVLTGGDEVRGDDALTLQSTATFCNKSSMIVLICMISDTPWYHIYSAKPHA